MRHALAASDEAGVAQLAVQNRQAALNAERWFVLEKWLSMLPDAVIQQRPELLLAQAYVHYYHFNFGFIPSILDAAESLLSHQSKVHPLYGEIFYFKSAFYLFQGKGALSLKFAENALERIPETHHFIRGCAIIPDPKGGEPVLVFLHDDDVEEIEKLPRGLPDLPFFRHVKNIQSLRPGQKFGERYLYKWWIRACINVGVEGVDLYGGTRHSTLTARGTC